LLSLTNTQIQDAPEGSVIRVLDAGCGQGDLLAYLQNGLTALRPDLQFDIYGFDISWGTPETNAGKEKAISELERTAPGPDWSRRISLLSPSSAWPYADGFFHAIVSNQVLEHVADHEAFVAELKRTLAPGGFSAHLFPLKNYIYEGHIFVPFAHRFGNYDLAVRYLQLMHRIGFGHLDAEGRPCRNGAANPENQADWLMRFTNYRTKKEFISLGRREGLRVSFRFTQEFYWAKIRSLLKLSPKYVYSRKRSALIDWLLVTTLKYLSSITLYFEKPESPEDAELLFARAESQCPTRGPAELHD
jgi:SAM-dependent methyltransferase